ncbi:MAG: nucleotidyltransferase family protein [Bacillota bacterium]|uniref:NTP transferase domain-containing protein n=1 Tax=Thermanaerosceptrum fracticalcis TaxID=1712410 RepID=A0A7G6E335_THEFR|nr:nucleotidyltransferase family protein [Thermanaerosceptrum fracticalcis]QNB46489.1 NTP transferase domain-containing protein [Thermanaerosceptrum fracticalcis]
MTENLGVAVLAAGLARRMGKPKLLLPFGHDTILGHVLRTASALPWGGKVAVIGEPQMLLRNICQLYKFPAVYNPNHEQGMSTSLRRALQELPLTVDGIIFLLGDQPFITLDLIKAMTREFAARKNPGAIIVPSFRGQYYSPVLFGCNWRDELLQLCGDEGGRRLIRNHPEAVIPLVWDKHEPFYDIDTIEDYNSLCKEWMDDEDIPKDR